jgi:SAM-dependent methyltransferase
MSLLGNLPRGGTGLDLACGDGADSLLMASRGNRMIAVDISPIGLAIGRRAGGPASVTWVEADLDDWLPDEADRDFVLCFKFLDRRRIRALVDAALRPGGLFIGETFRRRPDASGPAPGGPTHPDYLLEPGEWGRLFAGYEILLEDETSTTARVVARRPE